MVYLLLALQVIHPSFKVFKPHFRTFFGSKHMMFNDFHLFLQLYYICNQSCLQHPLNMFLRIHDRLDQFLNCVSYTNIKHEFVYFHITLPHRQIDIIHVSKFFHIHDILNNIFSWVSLRRTCWRQCLSFLLFFIFRSRGLLLSFCNFFFVHFVFYF